MEELATLLRYPVTLKYCDSSCSLNSLSSPAQEQLSSTYPTLPFPQVQGTLAGSVQFLNIY